MKGAVREQGVKLPGQISSVYPQFGYIPGHIRLVYALCHPPQGGASDVKLPVQIS